MFAWMVMVPDVIRATAARPTGEHMAHPTDNWPKNPDGSNKKFGDLTKAEKHDALARAIRSVQAEFDDPAHHDRLALILSGDALTAAQ